MYKARLPRQKTQSKDALKARDRRVSWDGNLVSEVTDGSDGPDLNGTSFVPLSDIGYSLPMEEMLDLARSAYGREILAEIV